MSKKHPKKYENECKELEKYLLEQFNPPEGHVVSVYAFDDEGFRVSEVDIHNETSGTSWMRCQGDLGALALILACEDFVRTFNIQPFKPAGWLNNIDDAEDAKWKLQQIVKSLK